MDLLDNDLLIAKPVLLAATAGSSRHALVADEQMRPLFAYMRALTLPTSVFAAPEDWGTPELGDRIRRSATELEALVQAGIEQRSPMGHGPATSTNSPATPPAPSRPRRTSTSTRR